MADATLDEVLDMAEKLAQTVVEFVEEGEEAGDNMAAPRALLEEFEEIWRRTDRYWQYALKKRGDSSIPAGLKGLINND